MQNTKITLEVSNCCDRFTYVSNILQQAQNLSLQKEYVNTIQTLANSMLHYINAGDEAMVIKTYDDNIDNILSLRDAAFIAFGTFNRDIYTPVAKTINGS